MKAEEPNTISYCFDLQQVQVLPKVPIQEAFYAQQLSIYFFALSNLIVRNHYFLKKAELPENARKIRFFADGYGGQHKNSHVVHAMMFWLHNFSG